MESQNEMQKNKEEDNEIEQNGESDDEAPKQHKSSQLPNEVVKPKHYQHRKRRVNLIVWLNNKKTNLIPLQTHQLKRKNCSR